MLPSLRSVRITNFRSIRGEVLVPLDAPVVLIHGQNGTGKTSTLSAIELALTGHVESLARLDGDYTSHLVHKTADEARVEVTVEGTGGELTHAEIDVRESTIVGTPLLPAGHARVYAERCYLAQSTVSRLLEIYENKGASRHDSPLTGFVKELLGLRDLEALIDGLHIAGDVRRLRRPVPEYWYVRDEIADLEGAMQVKRAEAKSVDDEIKALEQRLRGEFELAVTSDWDAMAVDLAGVLESGAEESALQRLAQLRREIWATRAIWDEIETPMAVDQRATAERLATDAHAELEAWKTSWSVRIGDLFERLSPLLPNLPSPESQPENARRVAIATLDSDLRRCEEALAHDSNCVARIVSLEDSISKAQSRMQALDDLIGDQVQEADAQAKALAGIRTHISGDVCPVCSRDFKETSSSVTLDFFVSSRIAQLTENAGRLQSLVRERANEAGNLAEAERDREAMVAQSLSTPGREGLKRRKEQLLNFRKALLDIANATAAGDRAIESAVVADRRLAEIQSTDQRLAMIRESIDQFSEKLDVEIVYDLDGISECLERLEDALRKREAVLTERYAVRRDAYTTLQERLALVARRAELLNSVAADGKRLQALKVAKRAADGRIREARELRRRAQDVRNNIVGRVFNETLNALWRELFVRLAPDEPFVPAFALPSGRADSIEAILETLHRTGGRGGNPRAMLSAGNLNTAALTLFFALHFTANPVLPWLVVDDPVQSMDEVHIAQLAALLRVVSKHHGRQIIMAVHEKPLFDYLALELNPAFESDRLITVELGRSSAGDTWSKYEHVTWQPDPAIEAA